MTDIANMATTVAKALLPDIDPPTFDPVGRWDHVGLLISAFESRRIFLMVNSATKDGRIRRIAALHRDTGVGYPCVGSSEWGFFATHGEALLRAAYEAVTRPRA